MLEIQVHQPYRMVLHYNAEVSHCYVYELNHAHTILGIIHKIYKNHQNVEIMIHTSSFVLVDKNLKDNHVE